MPFKILYIITPLVLFLLVLSGSQPNSPNTMDWSASLLEFVITLAALFWSFWGRFEIYFLLYYFKLLADIDFYAIINNPTEGVRKSRCCDPQQLDSYAIVTSGFIYRDREKIVCRQSFAWKHMKQKTFQLLEEHIA